MSRKILPAEIIEIIAQQQGITKKKSEAFFRAFFDVIEEALRTDSFVKIKGFGTFKLVGVSERESVNINTGERIQIGGHTKVTFTPDNTLKELVNRPFSHFETTLIPESATQEDIDILNDTEEGNTPSEEETIEIDTEVEETVTPPSPIVEEKALNAQSETLTAFSCHEVKPLEVIETDTLENTESLEPSEKFDSNEQTEASTLTEQSKLSEPSESTETTEFSEPTSLSTSNSNEDMSTSSTPNKSRRFLIGLLWVITIIISYIAGYHRIIPLNNVFHETTPVEILTEQTDTILASVDTLEMAIDTVTTRETILPAGADTLSVIRGIKQSDAEILAEGHTQVEIGSFLIIGTYATHIMRPGDTLLKIARNVYGHKDYVKYIIHYNKFPNPDNVYIDTEILLPQLVEKEVFAEN